MFFERPESGSRALLVHIEQENASAAELWELTVSAGLVPVGCADVKLRTPDPRTFVGSGKLQEIVERADELEAAIVIFDHDLTPAQERNLERVLARRVLGRTGLILDIFAARARTHEGKLQVELAQLQHAATRLVRGWTHLDRQRGGAGRGQGAAMGVTGAGETQLEADQRMIGTRIKRINERLARVRRQRAQSRRARKRADVNTISLVGYTNAGKSTLFNRVCEADVHAADQLFATLDPTLRQLELPVVGKAILTDTVGFIRSLPHGLVDAFRATLEEVKEAQLLLHIVDASSPEKDYHISQVDEVLAEIGAECVPQLLVYNKIDLLDERARIDRDAEGMPTRVWLSAQTGEGIDLLIQATSQLISRDVIETTVDIDPSQGQLRAELFALGAVVAEETSEDGVIHMKVRIEEHRLRRLAGRAGIAFG
ncbi:MAG: GTPase HflX [Pseudomonadales bacterium]|nr:GTPase HflX [Pseudomonadales bacterium]